MRDVEGCEVTTEDRLDKLLQALDVELKRRDLETLIDLVDRILERAEQ